MLNLGKMVRIGGAFLAGVLVALASALIYIKATSVRAPEAKIVQTAEQSTPARPILADTTPPQPQTVNPPQPPTTPLTSSNTEKEKKTNPTPVHRQRVSSHSHPAELAQNNPPVLPQAPASPATAPAPAANPPTPIQPSPTVQNPPAAPQPGTVASTAPGPSTQAPSAPVPQRQPMTVTLEAGTPLTVRIDETLSTNTNYTGDTFRATLESPIIRDGYIIADRGSKVLGTIVNAQKAGRMSGVPELTLALKEINTTDHQQVQIETNTISRSGPSSTGENAAKMAGGAAIGAIIGAIAGGGKGAAIGAGVGGAAGTGAVFASHTKPAVIEAESQLTFRLSRPVTITEKLN
jgi:cytoskeletal protein RodZ